jgi:hypothetical protein
MSDKITKKSLSEKMHSPSMLEDSIAARQVNKEPEPSAIERGTIIFSLLATNSQFLEQENFRWRRMIFRDSFIPTPA